MGANLKPQKKEIVTDAGTNEAGHILRNIMDLPLENMKESQINYPEIFCPKAFPVSAMCISKTCQADALMCEAPMCPVCAKTHQTCGLIKMTSFTTLIQNRNNMHQQLIANLDKIQLRVFSSLKERRKVLLDKFFLKGFDKEYQEIVDSVFFDGDPIPFKGALGEEFYQKLKESNAQLAKAESTVLRGFTREIERIAANLTVLEGQMISQYIKKVKVEKIASISRIIERKNILESKIIPPEKTEDIKFIYEALDWPTQLQFLFRASENGYVGSRFHQVCDNKPHTLTIILTEFDKIIAGYTPLTWNMVKGMAADQTKQSFLLSIDLKQKMSLLRTDKAIQCIPTEGPVFGGGSDLAVTNLCHMNLTSCTNFPFSYNCDGKYHYNQEAWKALTGVSEGKFFKIKEYEVYRVIW